MIKNIYGTTNGTMKNGVKRSVAMFVTLAMTIGCVSLGSVINTGSSVEAKTYTKASINKEIKQLQKDVKSMKAKDKKQKNGLVLRQKELPYYNSTENSHVVYYMDLDSNPPEKFFYIKNNLTSSQLESLQTGGGALKLTSGSTTWEGHSCKNAKYVKIKNYSGKISKKQEKAKKLKKSLNNTVKISGSKTVAIGATIKLKATKKTSESYNTVKWSSDNTEIATVDQKGNVTAVTGGAVTITAKLSISGKENTYKVQCYTPATKITLNATELSLNGSDFEEFQLKATLDTNSPEKITWSSSNEDIAEVSSSGLVTAYEEGTCTITAKTTTGVTATVAVTVYKKSDNTSKN